MHTSGPTSGTQWMAEDQVCLGFKGMSLIGDSVPGIDKSSEIALVFIPNSGIRELNCNS